MPAKKFYKVTVITTFGEDPLADDSAQLARIMDVPGYRNLTNRRTIYRAGRNYYAADALFGGYSNMPTLQGAVREALGDAFWPSTNVVEPWKPSRPGSLTRRTA